MMCTVRMLRSTFFGSDTDTWGSVLVDANTDLIPVHFFFFFNKCRNSLSVCVELIIILLKSTKYRLLRYKEKSNKNNICIFIIYDKNIL